MVVPRPQRPPGRRHQPGHPRRSLPQRPAPFARGVRDRRRAARLLRRGRRLLGRGRVPARPRPAWFTEDDVRFLASLSEPIADGLPARACCHRLRTRPRSPATTAPASSCSTSTATPNRSRPRPSAGSPRWSRSRRPPRPAESKMVQAVAAQGPHAARPARTRCDWRRGPACRPGRARGCCCTARGSPAEPTGAPPSSSSPPPRTRSPRSSPSPTASPNASRQVTRLCMQGQSRPRRSREALGVSPLHRPGPPQVDLRQDRRPQPRRAGRPDLPRALRAALGGHARRARRLARQGLARSCCHRPRSEPRCRDRGYTLGHSRRREPSQARELTTPAVMAACLKDERPRMV